MVQVILAADRLPPAVLDIAQHAACRLSLAGPVRALTEPAPGERPALLVAGLDDEDSVRQAAAAAQRLDVSWIGWNLDDQPQIAVRAYEAGAAAVLPAAVSSTAFTRTVHTGLLRARANGRPPEQTGSRQYRRGERVRLRADHVLLVRRGVLALTYTHEDGVEALTGLCGPGSLVLPAADDGPAVAAHTDTTADVRPWRDCAAEPGFADLLRARLADAEAWTAVQGHPHLDQRVLGLLRLLARQFGVAHAEGTLLDLDLTHAQMATAVGTTRATLSRQVGVMRRRGQVRTVRRGGCRRFLLPAPG